jgi:drug/metabolite transporter (DMT)-like permease
LTPAHREGLLLVAGAGLVWSAGGLLFRLIQADVITVLAGRALAAGFFLLTVLTLRTRGRPLGALLRLGWPGLLVALFFAGDAACYIGGLHYTSVAHVVVIMSLTPLFAAMAAWLALREAVRSRVWIGMLVALAGVAVMVSGNFSSGAWWGDLLALGVPSLFAVVTVITRRHPDVDLLSSVCLAALVSAVLFLPFAPREIAAPRDWALMAVLGIVEFGGGLLLYLAGAKRIPSAEAALMSLLETVLAPLWVWLAVAENPGWQAIAGGVVVLAALAGVALADLRPAPARS